MMRLQSSNVRLLVLSIFIDKTHLDVLGRNIACPILVTLLNFTIEVLASDWSKKLAGYFPDVRLTDAQKKSPKIRKFMRDLYFYVTKCYLDDLQELYDKGGWEWMDSSGGVWNFVPVLSFVATDMEEGQHIKGVFKGYQANEPCHLCNVKYGVADEIPDKLVYRNGAKTLRLIKRFNSEKR